MKHYLALIALALVLSACGGGGNDAPDPVVVAPPPVTPAPVPVADAFTTSVTTVVAANSDTAEPAAFDSVAATAPDTTEPTAI